MRLGGVDMTQVEQTKKTTLGDALNEHITEFNADVEFDANCDTIIWCADYWTLQYASQYGINTIEELDKYKFNDDCPDFWDWQTGGWDWAIDSDNLCYIHSTNLTIDEAIELCSKYPSLVFQVNEDDTVALYQHTYNYEDEELDTNDDQLSVWYKGDTY